MINKSKMVSFRISDEEYRQLRDACAAAGVNNISEMARTAMKRAIAAPPNGHALADEVRGLRAKIENLSGEVDRISRLVDLHKSAGA